jgi:ribokinase
MKVAGLGQCSLDFIAQVAEYPLEDTKEEALSVVVQGGGPVATALVSLSRLGLKTFFAGVVSDDEAGREIKRGLSAEGVGVGGLKVIKGGSSQVAFIVANRTKGTRTIFWKRPSFKKGLASGELKASDVKPTFIKGKKFLLLDGLMRAASVRAARLARVCNVPIMLDAGRVRPGMMELAALSDYIVGAEDFALGLAPTPRAALLELAALKPRAATITLGPRGSITWADGKVFRTPAPRVGAVDTTGAGDVFHGGYIYGLLKGWDIKRTVEFASAFAALKCRRPGGRTGIPTLSETLRFMKKDSNG